MGRMRSGLTLHPGIFPAFERLVTMACIGGLSGGITRCLKEKLGIGKLRIGLVLQGENEQMMGFLSIWPQNFLG